MKKFLSLLLLFVLIVPVVVKADAWPATINYNKNVIVGGELQVNMNIEDSTTIIGTVTFEYDSSMLEISKNDILVTAAGEDVTNSSNLSITVENGKVTIESEKSIAPQASVGDDNTIGFELHFNALKTGDVDIRVEGSHLLNNYRTIHASVKACGDITEVEGCNCQNGEEDNQTNNSETETKIDDNKVVAEKEEKSVSEEPSKKTEDKANNDIFLYCSLGLNAVLLICLIVVAVKKKSTKTVEKVVEENKE